MANTTNRGIVNTSKRAAGVAAAAALAALLTACSSSGGSSDVIPGNVGNVTASTSSAAAPTTAVPQVVPPKATTPPSVKNTPVPPGRTVSNFTDGGAAVAAPSTPVTHTSSSVPPLSGPVTYESYAFPSPYDCAQAGTSYYTAPNVTVAVDVTVLVNSSALARDLVIAAPNNAPQGISNASKSISAKALGHNVWRATYRTFVSLYQPNFTPVTFSGLQATGAGGSYTIAFPSPVSVTAGDCHS